MITIENKGKGDSDFQGLQWAMKAKSNDKNEITYCNPITCVNIEAGWITCTDGHRLHSFASDYEVEDGVYEVKVSTKKLVGLEKTDRRFPDIDAVMPNRPGWDQIFHSANNGSSTHYVSELYRKTPKEVHATNDSINPITYDINYVLDSYIPDREVIGYLKDPLGPLVITSEGYCALIMPMRD